MALSKAAQARQKQKVGNTPSAEIVEKLLEADTEDTASPSPSGILRKAGSLGVPSTLVFGGMVTGKSTLVRDTVLAAELKPLWIALSNDNALRDERVKDWDIGSAGSWDEFNSGIVKAAKRGELSGYNAIVIDGGDKLTSMALMKVSPNGQPDRAEYLMASNLVHDALVLLRNIYGHLFMTVDVVTNKGERKMNLNPYAYNNIVPLFANKWYTNIVRERDDQKKLTGNKAYLVQRDADLALSFVNGN